MVRQQVSDSRQHFPPMPEEDADVLKVLIGQVGGGLEKSMPFSAKRWTYSDMPSFSSQSAICCIASPPCDEPHAVTNDDI